MHGMERVWVDDPFINIKSMQRTYFSSKPTKNCRSGRTNTRRGSHHFDCWRKEHSQKKRCLNCHFHRNIPILMLVVNWYSMSYLPPGIVLRSAKKSRGWKGQHFTFDMRCSPHHILFNKSLKRASLYPWRRLAEQHVLVRDSAGTLPWVCSAKWVHWRVESIKILSNFCFCGS